MNLGELSEWQKWEPAVRTLAASARTRAEAAKAAVLLRQAAFAQRAVGRLLVDPLPIPGLTAEAARKACEAVADLLESCAEDAEQVGADPKAVQAARLILNATNPQEHL